MDLTQGGGIGEGLYQRGNRWGGQTWLNLKAEAPTKKDMKGETKTGPSQIKSNRKNESNPSPQTENVKI